MDEAAQRQREHTHVEPPVDLVFYAALESVYSCPMYVVYGLKALPCLAFSTFARFYGTVTLNLWSFSFARKEARNDQTLTQEGPLDLEESESVTRLDSTQQSIHGSAPPTFRHRAALAAN